MILHQRFNVSEPATPISRDDDRRAETTVGRPPRRAPRDEDRCVETLPPRSADGYPNVDCRLGTVPSYARVLFVGRVERPESSYVNL
ncbi:hypothetical protein MPRS_14800 [Mycobacterium paraseoulense]|uniref:Uncharacterized protein n=1 Tax=Mycobacterium paraseoulense TaxID=590652 RepID=A0A1X0I838_9MYCO|nr:hypothetical protein BST39_17460 [Mycobacterium paraseoulense]BBZ70387.1 hypothetical protein MPRS_14800 [Mycobacterium paraseoulense]